MDFREAIRMECRKIGLTKVRERLSEIGGYDVIEAPIVEAWVKEEKEKLAGKIKPRDYISYGIALLGIVAAMIYGAQNRKLQDNRQQIYNEAKTIQQYITNNNYNFPPDIIEAVNVIATASGPVVQVKTFKNIEIKKEVK